MRILFDSQKLAHKDPFGCLLPGQSCTLHIHIPEDVGTTGVCCVFQQEDGTAFREVTLEKTSQNGVYEIWEGSFSLEAPGLFFYFFRIIII